MSEKFGAGHFSAMVRAGMKELSQALPAFSDSIRPVEEPGLAGNLTPSEVEQTKGSYEQELDSHAARAVQGRDNDKSHDMGMDR